MALDAIFSESWAQDIEEQVHADEESKRRAEAGYAAAEVEHERHGCVQPFALHCRAN